MFDACISSSRDVGNVTSDAIKTALLLSHESGIERGKLEGRLSRDDTHCDAIKPDKQTENWKFQRISSMFSEDKGRYNSHTENRSRFLNRAL